MSYDLAVWFPHNALSDEHALEQYYKLCNEKISGHKHIQSLISSIKSSQLCIQKFMMFPKIRLVMSILVLGVNILRMVACRLCLVLDLALKHGLVVFDPQLTKIHYPTK